MWGRPGRDGRDPWRLPKYRMFVSSRATSAVLPSSPDRLPLWSINPESLPGVVFSIFAIRRQLGFPAFVPLCAELRGPCRVQTAAVCFTAGENKKRLHPMGSCCWFVISTNASCSPGCLPRFFPKKNAAAAAGFPGMRPRSYGIVGKRASWLRHRLPPPHSQRPLFRYRSSSCSIPTPDGTPWIRIDRCVRTRRTRTFFFPATRRD